MQNARKSNLAEKHPISASQAKRDVTNRIPPKSAPVLNSPTLVWIDDYEPGLVMYKAIYENLGYNVHTASRGNEGLEILASRAADAVIVDYEMPDMDGGAVTESIKKRWPGMPVIMFSGSAMVPSHITNLVDAFCDKAGHREELQTAIQNVLQKKQNPQPHLV